MLITLLKVIAAPIQGSTILGLTVSFKYINSSFQIFLLSFLKCLLASHLTLLRLSTLLLFGFCKPCFLACVLWSKIYEHFHQTMVYAASIHTYLDSLAKILIFSLTFSQALFMSSLAFKFSIAAKLLDILIWCCFLNSSSLSFLRLNNTTSNLCSVYLLTASFSLTSATIR